MSEKHTAIIGTGSVAASVGWALSGLGRSFYFINRQGPALWEYRFQEQPEESEPEHLISATVPPDFQDQTDLVFVAVKAYDLAKAFDHLVNFTRPVVVVSLANGAVGVILENAARRFPHHIFRLGFSTLGITCLAQDQFQLRSSAGQYQFGPLHVGGERVQSQAERTICTSGSRFVWHDNILVHHRRKWLFNTVINTLTAARRLPTNGDLLVDLPTLSAVFDEAYNLAEMLWGRWTLGRAELYETMVKLIQDTADNENSMAADMRLGRPTESPFLAGLAIVNNNGRFPLLADMHRKILGQGR